MIKKIIILIFSFLLNESVIAQIGGDNAYRFLSLPTSARATMLGGSFNSIFDNDISLATKNPATLNPKMHKYMSLNYIPYFAGITFGNFNYVHDFKPATFQFGATYMNYGELPRYDIYGSEIGLMTANEFSVQAGAGKSYMDKYNFGANAKMIVSQLGEYTSVGMAFDLAAMWTDTAHLLNVSFNITNLGFQIKTYREGNQELLPVDVQLSISKRLKHVPFRFILTAHHLYTWDIRYDNPNSQSQNNSIFNEEPTTIDPAVSALDNIARHLIFAGEIYIGKAFTLGFGYNHLKRAEMAIPALAGLAGFSAGFGIRINRFQLQYAIAKYALPSSVNHLTLNVNLGKMIKKKKRIEIENIIK